MTDQQTDLPMPTNVIAALARVMGEIGGIEKLNPTQRAQRGLTGGSGDGIDYAYRGIDQITQAAVPLFHQYGVVIVPEVLDHRVEHGLGRHGNMTEHIMQVAWTIYGPGGADDCIRAVTAGESRDSGDKGANKAQTAAFKNLLLRVLCITDPQDDTDNYDTRDDGSHAPRQQGRAVVQRDEASDEELEALFSTLKPQQRLKVQQYAARVLGIREFKSPGPLSGNLAQAMRNVAEGREPGDDGTPPAVVAGPQDPPSPTVAASPQEEQAPALPTAPPAGKRSSRAKADEGILDAEGCAPGMHDYTPTGTCRLCGAEEPF